MTNPIASKPDAGSEVAEDVGGMLRISQQYQTFLDDVEEGLNFPTLPAFTVAELNATTGRLQASANQDVMAIVTDETTGRVPAYSDGTDWKRFSDNTPITT